MKKHIFKLMGTLFAGLIYLAACNHTPKPAAVSLIAKVADKSISTNEFISRAEYTIRPDWCKGDSYIHRKIVLNSLIAEKLLALEAGDDNRLTRNPEFQLYMQGRKEQAMRQWLYEKEAVEKVHLDPVAVQKEMKISGRTYHVSFLHLPNEKMARDVHSALRSGMESFDHLYKEITGEDKIARKDIPWQHPEADAIREALFVNEAKQGAIIGPLKMENNDFLLLRVDGWTDRPVMSDTQARQRLRDVKEQLIQREALRIYGKYIRQLMKGKRVDFVPETFRKLVTALAADYYKSDKEKKQAFNKKFWNKDNSEMVLDNPQDQLKDMLDQPLLQHEGKTWSVRDFMKAIAVHPLVFRKKRMPKKEFARQFKLAIVDMIRDQHITKDAYAKGYDNVPAVQNTLHMWKDNMLALYQKQEFLKTKNISGLKAEDIVRTYLDPYVHNLQIKYNDQIQINTDTFEKIKLTHIDMFVIQKNVPFPVIVPSFPQLTTWDKLDYGHKMNTQPIQ